MKNRQTAALLGVFALATAIPCESAAAAPEPPNDTVHIELSQPHEHVPWPLQLFEAISWPIIAGVAIIIFRKPATELLKALSLRGTELDLGILAVKIPALETKVESQTLQIEGQQGQLDKQNENIQYLIRFSMSWFIYDMLYRIRKSQRTGGEYLYRRDGSMNRNLRFLTDQGYIQEVYPEPEDGQDLCKIVHVTEAGDAIIAMRGPSDGSA